MAHRGAGDVWVLLLLCPPGKLLRVGWTGQDCRLGGFYLAQVAVVCWWPCRHSSSRARQQRSLSLLTPLSPSFPSPPRLKQMLRQMLNEHHWRDDVKKLATGKPAALVTTSSSRHFASAPLFHPTT